MIAKSLHAGVIHFHPCGWLIPPPASVDALNRPSKFCLSSKHIRLLRRSPVGLEILSFVLSKDCSKSRCQTSHPNVLRQLVFNPTPRLTRQNMPSLRTSWWNNLLSSGPRLTRPPQREVFLSSEAGRHRDGAPKWQPETEPMTLRLSHLSARLEGQVRRTCSLCLVH